MFRDPLVSLLTKVIAHPLVVTYGFIISRDKSTPLLWLDPAAYMFPLLSHEHSRSQVIRDAILRPWPQTRHTTGSLYPID